MGDPAHKTGEIWLAVRDSGRALSIDELAKRLGYFGHQIAPSLHVLVGLGWVAVVERDTKRWYMNARLRRWLVG